jgi:tetratricopeptide (TPR) repeat protein
MPTPSASPSPVPFPPQPGDFNKYAKAIVGYLIASRGDVDGLREMLESWGALRHATHLLRVDVDDDGQGEFLITLVDPTAEYVTEIPGDLLVIDIDGEEYRLSYQAASDRVVSDPALLEVDDLNGDGHTELAFSSTACGAHTCTTTAYIVGSGLGTYDDLVNGGIEMTFAEVQFTDWDGDSVSELVMYGGIIGSVGAGPQRARTEVYKWDGRTYALVDTIYDPSNYLYFKVLDANQALLEGDYAAAAELYQQAIENPNLEAWMGEYEREDLTAFSRYRLALTYLMIGDADAAKAVRDEVLKEQPDHIYAQVVTALWDAYLIDGDLRSACDEVAGFASEHPQTADVLANYGYGNPTFTPEEVCPISLF